jgi:hypothetical protein
VADEEIIPLLFIGDAFGIGGCGTCDMGLAAGMKIILVAGNAADRAGDYEHVRNSKQMALIRLASLATFSRKREK